MAEGWTEILPALNADKRLKLFSAEILRKSGTLAESVAKDKDWETDWAVQTGCEVVFQRLSMNVARSPCRRRCDASYETC